MSQNIRIDTKLVTGMYENLQTIDPFNLKTNERFIHL